MRRDVATLSEFLETRTLLSAINWDGGAGTLNWGDAANWSTDTLPGPADDVTIDATGAVTITSTGTVSVKSLISADHIEITGGSLSVLETATFNGGLTQSGGSMSVSNTFTAGTINIQGGSATLGGGTLVGTVSLTSSGLLAGAGSITGDLSNAAAVSPGSSPGVITVNGNYSQTTGGDLNIELSGTTAGTQYDQLVVNGTVTLDGALNLTALNSFIPASGDTFTIIDNDSNDPVVGTFVGLADGATINFQGRVLAIDYQGGDGNDVTLKSIDTSLSIASNKLTILDIGLDSDDNLKIQSDTANGKIIITDPGNVLHASFVGATQVDDHTVEVLISDFNNGFQINTGNGDDTLTVDFGLGNFANGLIRYVGGGNGGTGDALVLQGGTFASVTHTFTNANDGSVSVTGNSTINYTGLEPITDNLIATDRVFTFSSGDDAITLVNAAGANMTIDSNLAESVTFVNPTNSLTINAGSGADTVAINSVDGAFAASLNVNGDGGTDAVTLAASVSLGSGSLSLNAETLNLGESVQTDGGSVTLTGNTVITASSVLIDTEVGNDSTPGSVTFNGGSLSASAAGYDLSIQTSASSLGGNVTLSTVGNGGGAYLNDLTINTSASTAGTITLGGDISTDNSGSDTGELSFNGSIVLTASQTWDTEQGDNAIGGSVNLQDAAVSAFSAGIDLTIRTTVTGFFGNSIKLGSVGNSGGAYLNDLSLSTGDLNLWGVAVSLDNNGSDTGDLSITTGGMILAQSQVIDTEQGNDGDGGLVTISAGSGTWGLFGGLDLSINTATTLTNGLGGNVTYNMPSSGFGDKLNDFTINASGTTVGTISLGGDILTDASGADTGDVSLTGQVVLIASQTWDTDSGDDANAGSVSVSGSISASGATRDLTINTTTGGTNTSGNISLNMVNSAGGFALQNLTLNAARATTPGTGSLADVTLANAITLASNGNLDIDGQTVTLSTSSSDVAVSGAGTISIDASRNVVVSSGASLTTVDGNLTVNANQQATPTAGNFVGADIDNGLIQATGSGTLTVNGKGGNDSSGSQVGVRVVNGGDIIGGTTATVTVVGVGGAVTAGGQQNNGVLVTGSGSTISSGGGNVQVTGSSAATIGGDAGVWIDAMGQITAGSSGTVTVQGTGGTSGGNHGVVVGGIGQVTSSGGNVSVTGFGGGGGSSQESYGVILGGGEISAGASGSVTVEGTGGTGTNGSNHGLLLQAVGTITSSGGNVLARGFGGSGSGSLGVFVHLSGGAGVITAGGAGTVTVEGSGGTGVGTNNNTGVLLNGGTITSSNGAVSVTGTEGSGSSSIAIINQNSGMISHTNNGNATLIGNSLSVDGTSTINVGAGDLTIRQRTNGIAINLGSAADTAGGPLSLSDAELDRVTAGTVNIGNTTSGTITVSDAISRAAATNLSLTTGGAINFSGSSALLDVNGGNVTLTASSGAITSGTGTTDVRANGVTLTGGASGIGSNINPFITDATSLTAIVNSNGPSYLSEIDTVNVVSLSNHTGAVNLMSGTFRIAPGGGINGYSPVFIDSAAVLQLNGNTLYLNSPSGSGRITNDSVTAGALQVYNDFSRTFSGVLGGPGADDNNFGLTILGGPGRTLTLTGTNTYTGATAVNGSTLAINGSITSNVTVTSPGTLKGSGTITGNVSGTGTFSPGNSPGVMTINGDFTPSGTVNFEVNSAWATPGTDFDQYVVNGGVDLTGATVTFSNANDATAPTANSLIKLINNDGTGDATTVASTPAQGAVVTIGSRSFKIFYNGGDGNDVVIVENSTPAVVYVDDSFTQNDGVLIADADLGTTGSQAAIRGSPPSRASMRPSQP